MNFSRFISYFILIEIIKNDFISWANVTADVAKYAYVSCHVTTDAHSTWRTCVCICVRIVSG